MKDSILRFNTYSDTSGNFIVEPTKIPELKKILESTDFNRREFNEKNQF